MIDEELLAELSQAYWDSALDDEKAEGPMFKISSIGAEANIVMAPIQPKGFCRLVYRGSDGQDYEV